VPVARDASGAVHGVQAVLDKDRTAALMACALAADALLIATDVPNAVLDYGTPHARPLNRIGAGELRAHLAGGQFAEGSMGPKVESAVRFVESGGRRAVITGLDGVAAGLAGQAGTVVEP
ncbi:carbamate kinase, partial [Streptomonospora algeriensis]